MRHQQRHANMFYPIQLASNGLLGKRFASGATGLVQLLQFFVKVLDGME